MLDVNEPVSGVALQTDEISMGLDSQQKVRRLHLGTLVEELYEVRYNLANVEKKKPMLSRDLEEVTESINKLGRRASHISN